MAELDRVWEPGFGPIAAIDALTEGILVLDSDGRLVHANREARAILDLDAADGDPDVFTRRFALYEPDGTTPLDRDAYPLRLALRGVVTDWCELTVEDGPSGAFTPIAITAAPIQDAAGETVGAAAVFRDISGLKERERELHDTIEALENARLARGQLTRFLLHDLKSPLTTIMGIAGLELSTCEPDSDRAESMQNIVDAANRVNRMVVDLLDIQIAQDGGLTPELTDLDGRELLEKARTLCGPRARLAEVNLEVAPLRDPPVLRVDRNLMLRVLGNLIDNCLKFGPKHSTVSLDCSSNGDHVRLEVSDEGPGVPDVLREEIFEEYARAERGPGGRYPGSHGIGLRFCRVAVEAHGGRIWVEDKTPHGARFVVELPSNESAPSEPHPDG